jgi:hypothetical protein
MPSPEQILDDAPKEVREVLVEANAIAYLGDLLMAWKAAVLRAASIPVKN